MNEVQRKPDVCRRAAWGVLFLALTGTGLGCGPGKGDVTGSVTYKDKALKIGTVQFTASDGAVKDAQIQPDGTFSLNGVAVGLAKVSVVSRDDERMVKYVKALSAGAREMKGGKVGSGTPLPPPKELSFIPETYGDPITSGLTFKVEPGKNTYKLDLK
jgi:hypothetical protein